MREAHTAPSRAHRLSIIVLEACWLAAVVLVPLVLNFWGMSHGLLKSALLRALTLVMAAAHVIALATAPQPPNPRQWLRRPLIPPILLLATTIVVYTVASLNPLASTWGFYGHQGAYLLLCVILWALIVAAHLRTPAQRRRLTTAVVLTGTLVALIPFGQAIYRGENLLTWRASGTLTNPIFLGAYLIMVIPFTLNRLAEAVGKSRPRRFAPDPSSDPNVASAGSSSWSVRCQYLRGLLPVTKPSGWGAALAVQVSALLATQSRGPWAGALAGLAVFGALVLWPTRRRVVLAVVALAAVLLLTGTVLLGLDAELVPSPRFTRSWDVGDVVGSHVLESSSLRSRLMFWRAGLEVVTRWPEAGLNPDPLQALRPLVGYGPESAVVLYNTIFPPELARVSSLIWDRAHNQTVDCLVMRGWLGLAAAVVLAVACARRALALWRKARTPVERTLVAAPLAALAAHAIEVQFAFSVTTTSMMAWLCVAWLASGAGILRTSDGTAEPRGAEIHSRSGPPSREPRPNRRWRAYAAAAALLLVLLAARVEGGAVCADVLVARARSLGRAGRWDRSLQLHDRALALIPWQAIYHQLRAEEFYNLARALPDDETELRASLLEAADRGLRRARQLEPLVPEYYTNAAVIHAYWSDTVDPGHLETAVAFYHQAFALAPTRARLRVRLGDIYRHEGLYDEALAQYRAALQIDPLFTSAHYGSGLAYQALGREDSARRSLRTALLTDPDCRESLNACRECVNALRVLLRHSPLPIKPQ